MTLLYVTLTVTLLYTPAVTLTITLLYNVNYVGLCYNVTIRYGITLLMTLFDRLPITVGV